MEIQSKMSDILTILPCPICGGKGRLRVTGGNTEKPAAYIACDSDQLCGFFVDDVITDRNTEVAKELLRINTIKKWNAVVKECKE